MKKAPLLRMVPLAYLLLLYISQWWYVQFADGARRILYGFPLAYITDGHGTTPTTEIYAMELLVDYLFYLGALYLLYRLSRAYLSKITLPEITTAVLWVAVAAHFVFFIATILIPGKLVVFGRLPYVVAYMLEKGFAFFWYAPGAG